MFSLAYPIEDEIEVNGQKVPIHTAFDVVLRVLDVLQDPQLSETGKLRIILQLFFGKETEFLELPAEDQATLFHQVFSMYVKQEEKKVSYDLQGNPLPEYEEDTKACYSLKEDAPYIYASFMQAYGIDLLEEQGKLHWFKFQALLSGLPEDTKFRQVVAIRMWEKPSKSKNAHEKQMRELQKIYALPDEEVDPWQTEE